VESYVLSRERSAEVAVTYQRWARAAHTDRGVAFAAYRTALDPEHDAARVHQQYAKRVAGAPHPAANDTP
jgi:hypothetical protein